MNTTTTILVLFLLAEIAFPAREGVKRSNQTSEVKLEEPVSGHLVLPNEKDISHDRVSWQTRCTHFGMGPLASSIGYTFSLVVRDRFAENRKSGIKPHRLEPAGLLSRGIVRNE
jgi:hypothetical protein